MKLLHQLAFVSALLLPLSSCNDKGTSAPLAAPDSTDVPKDDGRVFQPPTTGGTQAAPVDAPVTTPGLDASGAPGPQPGPNGEDPPPPAVPEPTTLLLVGTGLACVAASRRRREKDPEADGEA
ncbi:MAG: PEP-CTERM sorting domain-containing protein [Planctomycetota bacterium]